MTQQKMVEDVAEECSLTDRDLISILDFSPEEIGQLFDLTQAVKDSPASFHSALKGKQIVLFFEKASMHPALHVVGDVAERFTLSQTRACLVHKNGRAAHAHQ